MLSINIQSNSDLDVYRWFTNTDLWREISHIEIQSFVKYLILLYILETEMNSRKYMDLEWIKNVTVTWCAWGSWCFFTNYLVAEFDKILFIIVGGMVFLLMPAISQVAILKAVRRQSREIAPAATNCITVTRAREKKMMVTVRYILAAVFGSVVPSTLTGIATVVTGSRSAQTFLSPFPMTMFCLSSCLNPLVYFWRHLDMRSAALALVGR